MLPIEELVALPIDALEAEVRASLAPGWSFECELDVENGWYGILRDAEQATVWEQYCSLDPQVVMLSAYGWLHYRDYKPVHPSWVRRSQKPAPPRTGRMTRPGLDEEAGLPADLDPEAARSVYCPPDQTKRR